MRLFFYSIMCLWAFLLTSSCKGQAETIANDPTKKTIHEIETSYNLEGKTVTLEGYLRPGTVSIIKQ